AGAVLLGLSLLLAASNLAAGITGAFFHQMITPTFFRRVADVLENRIDGQNRLLITPSGITKIVDRFSFYLSGNYYCIPNEARNSDPAYKDARCGDRIGGVWISEKYEYIPHDWEPEQFSAKLEGSKIRYVLVCRDPGQFFFIETPPGYSLGEEYRKLSGALLEMRPTAIYSDADMLIFEIPDD
ncbi:MAG: hypothetical protein JSV16_00445, partial [Candidatus Hydrogenedentota bacterium]